ncbi:hypothetical protein QAD02_004180 [Eretmocerus hayati]|uniref:Uncharacterized protein n=1 Tax=Eretmocerus hayati TaxID=131215 RepID=A0ACC2NRI1_9HYME|nr:hypothetical protein QAD02_004180 [Eretmocerus hayati]
MSSTSDAVLEETSRDYAAYASLDMHNELKDIYEAVEEMQLRLEEFTSIVGMMQAKGDKSIMENVPQFKALRPHINTLCRRVDALENFIAKANADLYTLEANMDVVESAYGSDNKLVMLNPFSFFKKPSEPTINPSPQTHKPANTFKVEDYFSSNTQAERDSKSSK